jgi:exodeoxyribonuclease VII small subunit
MSKKEKTPFSYDAAMAEIEKIVAQLQEDALSLDQMAAQSKYAAQLIQQCRAHLRKIENDLQNTTPNE